MNLSEGKQNENEANCMEYALQLVNEYAEAREAANVAAHHMGSAAARTVAPTVAFDTWVQLKENEERKLAALRLFFVAVFCHVKYPLTIPADLPEAGAALACPF